MRAWWVWLVLLLLTWVSWPLGLLTLLAWGLARALYSRRTGPPILPPFFRSNSGFGPDDR